MTFDNSLPHALPWNYPWIKDEIERRDEYIAQLEAELAHQRPQNGAHGAIEHESVKIPAEDETEAHSEPDSREKLEADMVAWLDDNLCVDCYDADIAYGWLDRQAAITERECMERATSERIGWNCAECAEGLGRELDARCDPLKQRIAELTAERDEWKARAEENSNGWAKANAGWAKADAEAEVWRKRCDEWHKRYRAALGKAIDCADEIRRLP